MKRTEMCKKIKDIVNKVYTVQNIESMEELHLASILLSEIEVLNIMKPVTEIKNEEGITLLFGWESEEI